MIRRAAVAFSVLVLTILITSFTSKHHFSFFADDKDYATCVKKYNSKWGDDCTQCSNSGNSYKVFLRNTCPEKLDVKIGVQEKDKHWRTFIKLDMNEKDTCIAYACDGVGKYMLWAKKSSDKSTEFPTDNEINAQYNK